MIDNRLKKEKFRIEGKKPAAKTEKKEFASDNKGRVGTQGGKAISGKKPRVETRSEKMYNGKRENGKGQNGKVQDEKAQNEKTFSRSPQNDKRQDGKTRNDKTRNDKIRNDERSGNKFHKERGQGNSSQCPVYRRCGSCQLLHLPYKKQLEQKQKDLETLLKPFCRLESMIGMSDPYHYRNKVHAVFDHDRKGNPISGVYEANSHIVVPVESCLIEDQKSEEIIGTIRGMLKSFKIRTYDEDTGYGLLRHV